MTERRDFDEVEVQDKREHGFFMIDNEVLDNYNLSANAFKVYATLVRFSFNMKQVVKMSQKKLCDCTGMSDKTFSKSIKELEEHKLIEVFEKKNEKKWTSHFYSVLPVFKDITCRNISDRIILPVGETPTVQSEELRQPSRKNSDSPVGISPVTKTSNKYIKKDLKKSKNLFDLPQPKSEEELFSEKVNQYKQDGKMLNYKDFVVYYSSIHQEVFSQPPGGSPRMDVVKEAISVLTNELSIPTEKLLWVLPNFLKAYKQQDGYGRLSFSMIVKNKDTALLRTCSQLAMYLTTIQLNRAQGSDYDA